MPLRGILRRGREQGQQLQQRIAFPKVRLTPSNAVFPNLPSESAVVKGRPPPGVQTTPGSVYGNLSQAEGSKLPGGWVDKGDVYTKGPMKGLPLPQYTGAPRNVPGVSLPFKESAGRPEHQEGALVRVRNPLTGQTSLVSQVDIGPNMFNPVARHKGIDINAALAEQWGYVGTQEQSRLTGKPVFPTGTKIEWEAVTPAQIFWERRQRRAEARRDQGPEEGIGKGYRLSRELDQGPTVNQSGKLTVDANAPEGVKVSASGDGVFDKTQLNRETAMSNEE